MSPIISNVNTITNVIDEIAIGGGPPALADIDNDFSMEFDGVDDYMTTGVYAPAASDLTLSFWIKDPDGGWSNDYPAAIAVGHPNSGLGLTYLNKMYIQGTPQDGSMGGWGPYTSAVALNDGNWHHLVYTYTYDAGDSTKDSTYRYYLDGSQATLWNGVDYGTVFKSIYVQDPSNQLGIGAEVDLYSYIYGHFKGKVDEVAVWDSALGASDILAIYDATDTGKIADLSSMSTPPIAWYRMGD
jgi:hypothetical protein